MLYIVGFFMKIFLDPPWFNFVKKAKKVSASPVKCQPQNFNTTIYFLAYSSEKHLIFFSLGSVWELDGMEDINNINKSVMQHDRAFDNVVIFPSPPDPSNLSIRTIFWE